MSRRLVTSARHVQLYNNNIYSPLNTMLVCTLSLSLALSLSLSVAVTHWGVSLQKCTHWEFSLQKGLYQTIASRRIVTSARHVGSSRQLVTSAHHVGVVIYRLYVGCGAPGE